MLIFPFLACGETVRVAVASNFASTMEKIKEAFEALSSHELAMSYGSTGKLYAQIRNGAPYDLFLAADVERPMRLEREERAVSGSRFTYAFGRLVLWSPTLAIEEGAVLKSADFRFLALANPKLAPYGEAARAVLLKLALWDSLMSEKRIVVGENIGQTFQFVKSGNAQIGFVARSQIIDLGLKGAWEVPPDWYDPIEQQGVLLSDSPGAKALCRFLASEQGLALISKGGYRVP